jgi:putative DNA primase/helicase
VLTSIVSWILKDYCCATPIETFTESKSDRHPTEMARLHGARLVTSSETEGGRYWAETRLKEITGGDMVPARFMRQDFFQYRPQFKPFISGNHKPRLRSPGPAMRRRLNMIPFAVERTGRNTQGSIRATQQASEKNWSGLDYCSFIGKTEITITA